MAVKGLGGVVVSESVRKGKFLAQIFFSDNNVEWSSKYLRKMIFADVKANKNNNKKKRSGGSILQIFIRSTFKTWNIR